MQSKPLEIEREIDTDKIKYVSTNSSNRKCNSRLQK